MTSYLNKVLHNILSNTSNLLTAIFTYQIRIFAILVKKTLFPSSAKVLRSGEFLLIRETTQDIWKVMLGSSCHDATQGTKGRKRCLSKLSIISGDILVCCFQGGKEETNPNLKMTRRVVVEVAREERREEKKENKVRTN